MGPQSLTGIKKDRTGGHRNLPGHWPDCSGPDEAEGDSGWEEAPSFQTCSSKGSIRVLFTQTMAPNDPDQQRS